MEGITLLSSTQGQIVESPRIGPFTLGFRRHVLSHGDTRIVKSWHSYTPFLGRSLAAASAYTQIDYMLTVVDADTVRVDADMVTHHRKLSTETYEGDRINRRKPVGSERPKNIRRFLPFGAGIAAGSSWWIGTTIRYIPS